MQGDDTPPNRCHFSETLQYEVLTDYMPSRISYHIFTIHFSKHLKSKQYWLIG